MLVRTRVVLALLCALCSEADGALYDTYWGREVSASREVELRARGLVPWCALDVGPCARRGERTLSGACANPRYPPRGAALTPYARDLPPHYAADGGNSVAASGDALPNVRRVRVALLSDGRASSRRYTQLVTHALVFLTADVSAQHDTINYVVVTRTCCAPGGEADPRCLPVRVPRDDPHLRRSAVTCLNLTRAITYQDVGCLPATLPRARINTTPPLLDLSPLYGNTAASAQRGRAGRGGELRSELLDGKEWPPSGSPVCLLNDASKGETRCHNSSNPGVNTVLGINLWFMWLFRSHNSAARTLTRLNPCWSDERVFLAARDITIARYQHVLYNELWSELLGREFLLRSEAIFPVHGGDYVEDFSPREEPRVSLDYVAASRWFHTMQEGRLWLVDDNEEVYAEEAVVDYTLRTGALALNDTLAALTRGATAQPAARGDGLVDPDVGERILGGLQWASDVTSSDLMKGRDSGLPPYRHYRRLCRLPDPASFDDLRDYMPQETVEALRVQYASIDDVELLAGLWGEGAGEEEKVPATLACLAAAQLRRWRRADSHWFENTAHEPHFTPEQLASIRSFSAAQLLCAAGDVTRVQPRAFRVRDHRNTVVPCSALGTSSLVAWRDPACDIQPPAAAASANTTATTAYNTLD